MSKFKKKFGKRILAYILSGAMIMSNMTAFANEPSGDTGGGYETVDIREDDNNEDNDELEEALQNENEDNASEETQTSKPDAREEDNSDEGTLIVETTEVETFETDTTETEVFDEETSEMEAVDEETTEVETSDEKITEIEIFERDNSDGNTITYTSTYDFTDGSIIPNDTSLNGTATVKSADGKLTVECGPDNGYGYNGPQHGSILKGGNKITIHVLGDAKVFIGGCASSDASASMTVTSGSETIETFDSTKTSACYHNDNTVGLPFTYEGAETDLVMTFGAGSTYVPIITVERTEPLVTAKVTLNGSDCLQSGDTIKLVNKDDADDVHDITAATTESEISLRVNTTYNIVSNNMEIKATSNGETSITTEKADINVTVDLEKSNVKTFTYTSTYDFRDGSIIPTDTDGKTTVKSADGKLIVSGSGYSYNGPQHGSVLVSGNKITIHVLGDAKVFIGGCQYSNASMTVTSGSETIKTFDPTTTSACYHNDNTAGLSFTYKGAETDLVMTFGAGSTYVPIITVERTEPLITANVTLNDKDGLLQSGDVIKLVNKDDASDVHKITTTEETEITLRVNATYNISSNNIAIKAMSGGQTTITTSMDDVEAGISVTVDLEESGVKTITYTDTYDFVDGSIIPKDATNGIDSAKSSADGKLIVSSGKYGNDHGSAFSAGNKITIHVLDGSAKVFIGGCVYSGKRAEGTNSPSSLTVTDKSGEKIYELEDTYVSACYNSDNAPTAGLSFTYTGEETDLIMTFGSSGTTYLPIIKVERTEPAVPVKITLKDDNNLLKTGDTIKLVNKDDEDDVYDLTKVDELLLRSNTTVTYNIVSSNNTIKATSDGKTTITIDTSAEDDFEVVVTLEEKTVKATVTLEDDSNLLQADDSIKLVNSADADDIHDITAGADGTEITLRANSIYTIVSSNNTIKATSDGKTTITTEEVDVNVTVTLEARTEPVITAKVTLENAELLQSGDTIKLVNKDDESDEYYVSNAAREVLLKTGATYNIVCSSNKIKAATSDGKTTITTEESDIEVTIVLEEKNVKATVTLENADLLQPGDTIKFVNKDDESDAHDITAAVDGAEISLKAYAVYNIVSSNDNINAAASDGKTIITTEESDLEVTVVLKEKAVTAKVTLKDNDNLLQEGDTVKLVNANDESDVYDITTATTETEILLKANATYNIVSSNTDIIVATSDGKTTITTEESDIFVTITLKTENGGGNVTVTYPVTYNFTDGSIIPADTSLNGTATVKSADGQLTVECGPENGYGYNGAQHGSILKGGNKITIHVPGSVKVLIGGCQYSNGSLTVTSGDNTIQTFETTKTAECYHNDATAGLSFEYTGEEADLVLTFGTGSTYVPAITVEKASEPVVYPATYDFTDGSIIPADTSLNGTATVKSADGQLTVECGPENGYGYNGAQHGSILKGGNKITIHVPGSVKVLIGGCQYSNGSLTVTSGDNTIQTFETTKTAECYHNDATAGLSFEYKGEETDLVLTFGAGSTYVPAIIVDKLDESGSGDDDPGNDPGDEGSETEDSKITADEDKDTAISVNSSKITVKAANLVETKKSHQYAVTVTYTYTKDNKEYQQQLTEGVHYTVAFVSGFTGLKGAQKVTIAGTDKKTDLGIFTGRKTVSYEIKEKADVDPKKNVAKAKLTLKKDDVKNAVYTGTYITPSVEGLDALEGEDNYKVVYKNNVNAGKASVTIIGQNEYYGSKVLTFSIKKADISNVMPEASNVKIEAGTKAKTFVATEKTDTATELLYTGSAIELKNLTLAYGSVKLRSREDYTVTYKNNAKAGTATATIKGANNLSGSIKVTYDIRPLDAAEITSVLKSSESTPLPAEYSSKGARLTSIKVGDIILKENTDYKVNYKGCTAVEIGTTGIVTVTGAGSYKKAFTNETVHIETVQGGYYAKANAIVDTSKLKGDPTKDANTIISAAKITDAAGVKVKADAIVIPIEYTNTMLKVTPVDANAANYKATDLKCHVAKKLSSVKPIKGMSIEKYFDGVNSVTLTTAEIAEILPDVEAADINIVSYKNNNKTGSATVTIEGKPTSKYYGTMNVKFKISVFKPQLGEDTDEAPDVVESENKIDVWDFAGGAIELDSAGVPTKYLDSTVYNNRLTEDMINSWFNAEPGTSGINVSSFEVKDDAGKVIFEFNGGGSSNHRIRTKNTKITRYDANSKKDADGNEYLGFVYSNASSNTGVYLGIQLDAGDIVTAVVGSNGSDSTIKFEPVDGSGDAQTFVFKAGGATAQTATFYATDAGEYKMYSVDEKLVVCRVEVQKTDLVTVSGSVTAPESLSDYSVAFTCRETGAVKAATVTGGSYEIELNEGYTYDVSLANANGYIVTNETPYFTLKSGEQKFTYDVTVESVDLVKVTGTVTGLNAVAGGNQTPLKDLALTFESSNIYIPELTLNDETGEFTLILEKGVAYDVIAEGVDDFTLKTAKISADADGAQNIEFEAKPVYNVTIAPEGVTADSLADTSFIFSRVYIVDDVKAYEEDYVYTFTGTTGIQLRDGQYEIKVGDDCPYTQKLTSDLKVDGQDVTKSIQFSAEPLTSWDFRTDNYTSQESYKGLKITGGKKHGAQYGMAIGGEGASIEIPVSGACKIIVSVGYNWDIGMEGSDTKYTDNTNSGDKDVEFEYTGEAGKVILTAGSTFTSYIKQIKVVPAASKAEYKDTITVGVEGYDYTTINDALEAARNMDRTDSQRVTIEIQPGDYEEMLVIDTPNVTLKNASATPSIELKNKGVDIDENAVRITSYYGHGYAYYSMGSDCKWDADILAINKENGCLSFENPGTGTTSGSYWNATVVVGADGFEADGIIFENSFNQYISKKAADDVIVPLSGAKEGDTARADMQAGDTKVQDKAYVERAAALAIMNNFKNINFDNCKFIGRQDTLYGGTGVTAAFYDCAVYGGTDYIFGGMTAVFAKCDLVFNTMETGTDVGYITAAQQSSGRGYLMYNCRVTSTTPGVDTASEKTSKPGYFGRPWAANTAEALFYKTIIDKTDFNGTDESLIAPAGWNNSLSGESKLSQEYASVELAGVDNSAKRASWATMLSADSDGNVKLADGGTSVTDDTVVAAFLGEWNPFEGKDMTISNGQ